MCLTFQIVARQVFRSRVRPALQARRLRTRRISFSSRSQNRLSRLSETDAASDQFFCLHHADLLILQFLVKEEVDVQVWD